MFKLVNYDVDSMKFAIEDTGDNVIEWYSVEDVKKIVRDKGINILGVIYRKHFAIEDWNFELCRKHAYRFGEWTVVVLPVGSIWGRGFTCVVKARPMVFFYKFEENFMDYPYGHFIASYDIETIIQHRGKLCLDLEVPSWTIDEKLFEQMRRMLWTKYANLEFNS